MQKPIPQFRVFLLSQLVENNRMRQNATNIRNKIIKKAQSISLDEAFDGTGIRIRAILFDFHHGLDFFNGLGRSKGDEEPAPSQTEHEKRSHHEAEPLV